MNLVNRKSLNKHHYFSRYDFPAVSSMHVYRYASMPLRWLMPRARVMAASVAISAELAQKLSGNASNAIDCTVLLVGRVEGSKIVCLGCASVDRLLELSTPSEVSAFVYEVLNLFPAGYVAVGLYKSCPEESVIEDGKIAFEQLTRSEVCLAKPLLAYVHFSPTETIEKKAFVYDTSSEQFVECGLIVAYVQSLMSSTIDFRVKGRLSIAFEASNDPELLMCNAERTFYALRDRISSPACVFHLQRSSVLLSSNSTRLDVNQSKCNDLGRHVEDVFANQDDGFQIIGKQKKNTSSSSRRRFDIQLLLQATGEEAIKQTVSCVPTIRYERKDFDAVEMILDVDAISTVSSDLVVQSLTSVLADSVCAQLSAMERCLCKFYEMSKKPCLPKVYHFLLPDIKQIVSPIYPEGILDCDLESYRRGLHTTLLLPPDRPLLRRSMRHHFPEESQLSPYLLNPHVGLPPSGASGVKAIVQGTYAYHHYMQDRMDDNGWGCAYRSLQTIFSWFRHQGYTEQPVPNHAQIQQALVDVGDKPSSFVNSRKWIGSMEVSYCLDKLIGISSKIIFVNSGAELVNKGHELVRHFQMQGTPIMIGGGVLAHTILGVEFNEVAGNIKFLILDPHYTGGEDLKVIQSKGWCGWKGPNFWDKTAYYNLCCPQRPRGI